MLTSEQISTVDNFDYLMHTALAANNGVNEEDDSKTGFGRFNPTHKNNFFNQSTSFFAPKPIRSPLKRSRKERIQSLIYKIL